MPSGMLLVRDSPGGVHREAHVFGRQVGHVDADQPVRDLRVIQDEALSEAGPCAANVRRYTGRQHLL